jgi:hypothetical protein
VCGSWQDETGRDEAKQEKINQDKTTKTREDKTRTRQPQDKPKTTQDKPKTTQGKPKTTQDKKRDDINKGQDKTKRRRDKTRQVDKTKTTTQGGSCLCVVLVFVWFLCLFYHFFHWSILLLWIKYALGRYSWGPLNLTLSFSAPRYLEKTYNITGM